MIGYIYRIMARNYKQYPKLPLMVKISNDLVRSRLNISNSAVANIIFHALIVNLNEQEFPNVTVHVSELGLGKIDGESGSQYQTIRKLIPVLRCAGIDKIIFDNTSKDVGINSKNIFSEVEYLYNSGTIRAVFIETMKPHLFNLKAFFTQYNFFEWACLSSFYSQQIYEILKSWEFPLGKITLKLDDFYDLISYPLESRNDFSSVRIYALNKAEKEIHKKTSLEFSWEAVKKGKKVSELKFIIGEHGKRNALMEANKEAEKKLVVAHNESDKRKQYIPKARDCFKVKDLKFGEICPDIKLRTIKCQICLKMGQVVSSKVK